MYAFLLFFFCFCLFLCVCSFVACCLNPHTRAHTHRRELSRRRGLHSLRLHHGSGRLLFVATSGRLPLANPLFAWLLRWRSGVHFVCLCTFCVFTIMCRWFVCKPKHEHVRQLLRPKPHRFVPLRSVRAGLQRSAFSLLPFVYPLSQTRVHTFACTHTEWQGHCVLCEKPNAGIIVGLVIVSYVFIALFHHMNQVAVVDTK